MAGQCPRARKRNRTRCRARARGRNDPRRSAASNRRHGIGKPLPTDFRIAMPWMLPEREVIKKALAHTHGNRAAAARVLGLHKTHLLNLMKSLGIE